MNLTPMRFKDYVWPHNPRVYEIRYKRDIVSHRVPFGLYTLRNMGRQHRVLKGEGEFSGPGAYTEFKKLATVFYDPTPGVLVHPLWDTTRAYFAALSLAQEPTENYVKYTFEFWECYEDYESGLKEISGGTANGTGGAASASGEAEKEYYTAVSGDCMWSIAIAHGLSLSQLLELNPQVKNPNILYVGDVLRVK